MLPFVLLFCAFVEAGHHITTLFTNMTIPLPLLRVRYHPQSKNLSVTLFKKCIVLWIIVFGNPKIKKLSKLKSKKIKIKISLPHSKHDCYICHCPLPPPSPSPSQKNFWINPFFRLAISILSSLILTRGVVS